jgi:plastocyanin
MNLFANRNKGLPFSLLTVVWLVAAVLATFMASGQSQNSEHATPVSGAVDVTVTLENIRSNAWKVTAVEGAEGITETGVENPVIRLEVGKRYRFVNNGGLTIHPFAIRGKDGEPVLGQRPKERPFELDPDVAFEADDEGVAFTFTEALAAAVSTYYCTAHPAPLMEGDLEVRAAR